MMPPTSIDGTDITGATIDGTDVTEITVDGDTVFSARVPKAGLLHDYNAADISGSDNTALTNWNDSEGTADLSGSGTLRTGANGINNQNAVSFDGSNDDFAETSNVISQPFVVFAVFNLNDNNADQAIINAANNDTSFRPRFGLNNHRVFAGELMDGGTPTTADAIYTVQFDGSNSFMNINGTREYSGDPGSNSLDGIGISDTAFNPIDGLVGRVLIYDKNLLQSVSDVEDALANQFNISI